MLGIIGAVVVAFLVVMSITVFYKAPSCGDGIQNQGEAGIDCGGPCPYRCTDQEQALTVLFTKTVSNGDGRIDIVASVENKNAAAAAKGVPYTIALYGTGQSFLQEISGTLDVPPAATVPLYIPGIAADTQQVIRAFLTIASDAPRWYSMEGDTRSKPVVANTKLGGSAMAPRIDAMLTNQSNAAMTDVQVIVFVHDVHGNVIAASRTVIPVIPAQGQATATFTWNGAFSDMPAAIEVMPVIPLP